MDTVDRIKVKNDQLKAELKQLIAQDSPVKTLSPIDINVEKIPGIPPKFSHEFQENKPEIQPSYKERKKDLENEENMSNKEELKPSEPKHEPQHESIKAHSSENPITPLKKQPDTNRSQNTYNFTPKPNLTNIPKPSLHMPKSHEPAPSNYQQTDNLLITKILNQDQHIGDLKQTISQLKRENNQLQQQVYQQPVVIDKLKQQHELRVEDISHKYQQQVQNYTTANGQLMAKISDLTHENQHLQQQYEHIVMQLARVQQNYELVLKHELNLQMVEESHSQRFKDYQTYIQVSNRLIQQNIVNKFVDKCDQIGLLIDNELNLNTYTTNQPQVDEPEDDDTEKLLGGHTNTTNQLLSQKYYPSTYQLMANATTKPVNKWRVVRKVLIAIARFNKRENNAWKA